ncbi:MAG: ADP-glyceromanno-heptose 6-epimerase [Bacteroidetes bacterium]|nr:ADP-glyceromanno-heptose 6-epimerase [Bacteroidota bacterium]
MIVVTGGAGFIGSCFVAHLNRMNVDDILIVDELGTSEKWKNIVGKRFSDYLNKETFLQYLTNNAFSTITAIVHLGANSSTTETNVEHLIENNYRYSQRLVEWAVRHSVRFIYASSAATYGDGTKGFSDDESFLDHYEPLNAYGFSKHIFDCWVRRNALFQHVVGIKFFNVFGPNEYHKGPMRSVVCKAYDEILKNGSLRLFKSYKPEYRDGEQKRDFIYVKDCTEVLWWLLNHPNVNGLFNLGSGTARTWNDLAHAIFRAMGKRVAIEYIEMPDELRDRYQYFTEARMEKLVNAGYPHKPTSLEDAVADYVQNYLLKGYATL